MAKSIINKSSTYEGTSVMLTTKHSKAIAIAPAFFDIIGASVIEYVADTDLLGSFSGEIDRQGNALDCAKKKCELSLNKLGSEVKYGLASEGSFGPHPFMPFIPCDHEILYFIDKKHEFHLHLSHLSKKTNYQMKDLDSWEELQIFASQTLFPSHALILRTNNIETKHSIFKGINSWHELEELFKESLKLSDKKKVWVETDMRANMNPTRMEVIGELGTKLAQRLATYCPRCQAPGWGKIRVEKGLECSWCKEETENINNEIFGCTKCDFEEITERADGLKQAEPSYCQNCNP